MTVAVQIFARDTNISGSLQEYIEKKVSRLDRYLPSLTEARVDVAEARSARSAMDRWVAQLTVHMRGVVLRAEERSAEPYAAVDAVLDKMQRQIRRYKGKRWLNRSADGGLEAVAVAEMEEEDEAEPAEAAEPAGVVVRRKRFAMTPMNEEEALEQMQLLGHTSFFVFYNADTNRINVLYRRNDGNYGLIEPEIG
ncbi:MAG: ribosome-associated translation inhibitor RaiA [Anaerolineales bacterium]|nr:ribosome-associated translation inhibitor RaiA [Anaerolineales bacterium]